MPNTTSISSTKQQREFPIQTDFNKSFANKREFEILVRITSNLDFYPILEYVTKLVGNDIPQTLEKREQFSPGTLVSLLLLLLISDISLVPST